MNDDQLKNLDDQASMISKSATALLMETNYTNRDEMISSITRSKQQSVLGKRAKITSD